MLSSSSSSQEHQNTPLSTADAELIAVEAELEEALTDGLRMCQRIGEEEAEVRAEKIRKEQEEDDARYFHMLREQASGRLKLFMSTEDYRWFKYCFQGYELPDGQSAQQILNMAAVHDEIPLAAQAASAKRWMKELSTIEAVWQHDHVDPEVDPDDEYDSDDEDCVSESDVPHVPERVAQWLRGAPIPINYTGRDYHHAILEDDDELEPHAYMVHRDHYAANRNYTNKEWYEWHDENL